jgi:antimicrobial peptide system SdpA family protein
MSDERAQCRRAFQFVAALLVASLAGTLAAQLPWTQRPGWLAGQHTIARALWPQGWAFFANAGRSKVLVAYRVRSGGDLTPATPPVLDRVHLWGVSRVNESEEVELRQLAQLIPDRYWWSCGAEDAGRCTRAPGAAGYYPLINHSRHPSLCGTVAFAVEQPVDWPAEAGGDTGRKVVTMTVAELRCTR